MTEQTKSCLQILEHVLKTFETLTESSIKFGFSRDYVARQLKKLKNSKTKELRKEYAELLYLYEQYQKSRPKILAKLKPITKKSAQKNADSLIDVLKNSIKQKPLTEKEIADVEYDASNDEDYDDRSKGIAVRDDDNKIKEYHYKILIRNQEDLEGFFSREEMDKVYRLYSNLDGANLLTRAVSREFSHLTFRDFKRILRAFNITKQSMPVAPHIIEESSEEEVMNLIYRNKENNILKKLEKDRERLTEKSLIDTQKELLTLRANDDLIEKIVAKYVPNSIFQKEKSGKVISAAKKQKIGKPIIAIFGDMHFGKKFDRPVFGRGYNKDIARERMVQISEHIIEEYKIKNSSEIFLICGGDIVESIMEGGMHPGHLEEMDLFKEEQIFAAVDGIKEMILNIDKNVSCNINVNIIGGNHGRIGTDRNDDKSRTAEKIISHILKRELESNKIKFNIPKNNLIKLVTGKLCVFVQHGDDMLAKRTTNELATLYNEPGHYFISIVNHWHKMSVEEGTNYMKCIMPPVCSTDRFILESIGSNTLPGFIMGSEPDSDCYGFDYKKITLY